MAETPEEFVRQFREEMGRVRLSEPMIPPGFYAYFLYINGIEDVSPYCPLMNDRLSLDDLTEYIPRIVRTVNKFYNDNPVAIVNLMSDANVVQDYPDNVFTITEGFYIIGPDNINDLVDNLIEKLCKVIYGIKHYKKKSSSFGFNQIELDPEISGCETENFVKEYVSLQLKYEQYTWPEVSKLSNIDFQVYTGTILDKILKPVVNYKLDPEVYFYAVRMLIQYLCAEPSADIPLSGSVCMFIALKYVEETATLSDASRMTGFSIKQIREHEIKILNALGHYLQIPSLWTFYTSFAYIAKLSDPEFIDLRKYCLYGTFIRDTYTVFPSIVAGSILNKIKPTQCLQGLSDPKIFGPIIDFKYRSVIDQFVHKLLDENFRRVHPGTEPGLVRRRGKTDPLRDPVVREQIEKMVEKEIRETDSSIEEPRELILVFRIHYPFMNRYMTEDDIIPAFRECLSLADPRHISFIRVDEINRTSDDHIEIRVFTNRKEKMIQKYNKCSDLGELIEIKKL